MLGKRKSQPFKRKEFEWVRDSGRGKKGDGRKYRNGEGYQKEREQQKRQGREGKRKLEGKGAHITSNHPAHTRGVFCRGHGDGRGEFIHS